MNISALRSAWPLLKQTASDWLDDNALRLSAALSYYSIFSIAPLLVITLGLVGWVGSLFGSHETNKFIYGELGKMLGPQSTEVVRSMVESASRPGQGIMATVIGAVTLILGASGAFGQLKDALNTIWEVKAKPGLGIRAFIRERLLSFGMVLVIGFLLLVSFVGTTAATAFSDWLVALLSVPQGLFASIGLFISLAMMTVLFATIFKVLPDVQVDWRNVWVGAFVTAVLFEAGKFGLALYLSQESTSSSYGAAAAVVLLLLWVYYASCILLFGAEFTKVLAAARGTPLQPSEFAIPATPEARAQEGMAEKTMPQPPRESLVAALPASFASPEPDRLGVIGWLCQRPVASILGAAGCGAALGLAARMAPHREDPEAQMRRGSRLLGAAAVLLTARFGRALARHTGGWISAAKRWRRSAGF